MRAHAAGCNVQHDPTAMCPGELSKDDHGKHEPLTCVSCGGSEGLPHYVCTTPPGLVQSAARADHEARMLKMPASDPVNHPAHYKQGGIEVIDCIEAWELGFCLGNTVKYVARAGNKDSAKTVEDLKKARWYLDREIKRLEG